MSTKSPYSQNVEYCFFDQETDINNVVFNVARAARVKQTHSSDCIVIDRAFDDGVWVEGDAIVTSTPNLPIGVITADCAPVLLHGETDGGAVIIGAAHAGWQGALGGILDNTVSKMTELGCAADTIKAWIGPCIGVMSYEVSKGFEIPFVQHDPLSLHYFNEKNDEKLLFDLVGYCANRLRLQGVHNVGATNIDTYRRHEQYYSHRRMTQAGLESKGRQLSAIMING